MADAGGGGKIKVMNPMGFPPQIVQAGMAPRSGDLKGRPVYLVDCRFDDGDILVEQMADWFAERMPEVQVEVRRKSGVYTERDPALYEEIRDGGGAAVVAVGH